VFQPEELNKNVGTEILKLNSWAKKQKREEINKSDSRAIGNVQSEQ
jgi:hypothetical protein